ncbi:hypothetical protein [Clostridium akagii]|uniref:hypothetical protein n=1 Tax=Clostridium akagii TaxID=91623 RepID=UPI00047E5113|nr:hypothetical protein [Clostridium akagii]
MAKVKYKGRKYRIVESQLFLDGLSGVRITRNGVTLIILSKHLEDYKRNLELHRLITGRGLRNIVKSIKK